MITGVDKGHTKSGPNYGAVGILKESEETREVGDLVIKYLKELESTVIDCTVDYASSNTDSINKRVNKANKQHLDLFISLHFNIGGGAGHGVEAYTYNGNYIVEADRILKNIEKLGYRNRGIKNGTSPRRLGVVNSTKAKAILIECMFIDNKDDVDRYNADKMARAIAEGITGKKLKTDEKQEMKPKMELKEIDVVVHGKKNTVKGFVQDDTNYIPIRFLEDLGYKLDWDKNDKSVVIEYVKKE